MHRDVCRRWGVSWVLALVASSVAFTNAQAQERGDPQAAMRAAATQAMARFAWLEGEWEGPANISMGPRRLSLTQRETVHRSAMNTVLLIQGRGAMRPGGPDTPEREVFAAAALLTFDATTKAYVMFSASGSGQAQQFGIELSGENGLVWGFTDAAGVRTRYTITRTAQGEWHEIGETSRDGGSTWTPMLEMTLSKGPARAR